MAERVLPVAPHNKASPLAMLDGSVQGRIRVASGQAEPDRIGCVGFGFPQIQKTCLRYYIPATKFGWLVEDIWLYEMLGYKSI